jgi:type II secretory pathway component PulC
MGRFWKRSKEPRSVRSITVATLVFVAAGCAVALIVRGTLYLRAPIATDRASATVGLPRVPKAPTMQPTSPLHIGEQVLSRNIFDSLTGSLAWEVTAAPKDGEPSEEADAGVVLYSPPCNGDLRLLGSVVHGRDPRRSMAALRKDGKMHLITVGERLGELELVALHPTEGFFRNGGGQVCSLPVYLSAYAAAPAEAAEPPPPAPAAADAGELTPATAKRPPAFSEEELKRNIRVLGPKRFAVTRELFTRARMNPSGVSRGARFRPQEKDGRARGMEVFKLREDSLLAHLGVKTGDVLRGLNGFSLTSADGVLEAFGHLGKDSRISLSIERGGAPTTIEYVLE